MTKNRCTTLRKWLIVTLAFAAFFLCMSLSLAEAAPTPIATSTSMPTPERITVTEVITLPCPGTLIETLWISECPDHTKLVEKIDALTILVEQVHLEQMEVADRLLELEVIVSDYGMTEREEGEAMPWYFYLAWIALILKAGVLIGIWAAKRDARKFTTNMRRV